MLRRKNFFRDRRQSIDLGRWPNVKAYVDRVAARPKVQDAMKAEGLLKAA